MPLPFEINKSREADENARLKYRYLDLRNPAVKENIILRCNVVSAIRAGMTAEGFLEITTPILTSSSLLRAPGITWFPPGITPASSTLCPRPLSSSSSC